VDPNRHSGLWVRRLCPVSLHGAWERSATLDIRHGSTSNEGSFTACVSPKRTLSGIVTDYRPKARTDGRSMTSGLTSQGAF
jgi:hypothetical protein